MMHHLGSPLPTQQKKKTMYNPGQPSYTSLSSSPSHAMPVAAAFTITYISPHLNWDSASNFCQNPGCWFPIPFFKEAVKAIMVGST